MANLLERYKSILQAFLMTCASVATVSSLIAGAFILFSDFGSLPQQVQQNSDALRRIEQQLGSDDLHVVDILGDTIGVSTPTVRAGEPIWILFHARANINCDRDIVVRFYNEDTKGFFAESRIDPAVRSAVSRQFQLIHIPIRTFEDMPPARYRYVAEVVPINCGVYPRQTIGISEPFEIVE